MAGARLVFVDTETTGLLAHFHEVWEIALIERKLITHAEQPAQLVDVEHVFHVRPDLSKADPSALRINRFYERTAPLDAYLATGGVPTIQRTATDLPAGVSITYGFPMPGTPTPKPGKGWDTGKTVAAKVARILDGAHMVGAVPSFDAAFLSRFLFKHGEASTWHYHLIDVEALAVGYLAGTGHTKPLTLPWSSDDIGDQLCASVAPEARHTALGDARWAKAMYDAVIPR